MFPTCAEEQEMMRDLPKLMREAKDEIVDLRISIARVAQAAGVTLAHVGLPDDAGYELLFAQASMSPRGWNILGAEIILAIPEL